MVSLKRFYLLLYLITLETFFEFTFGMSVRSFGIFIRFVLQLYENIDQILPNKLHVPMHYKIGVTCVYIGHAFYTLLKLHDSLIHLFHNSTVRVMNSRVFGQCLYTIPLT